MLSIPFVARTGRSRHLLDEVGVKRFVVKKYIRVSELFVETVFVLLDAIQDARKILVASEYDESSVCLAWWRYIFGRCSILRVQVDDDVALWAAQPFPKVVQILSLFPRDAEQVIKSDLVQGASRSAYNHKEVQHDQPERAIPLESIVWGHTSGLGGR